MCSTQWPVGFIVNPFKSLDEHVQKPEEQEIVNGKQLPTQTNREHDFLRR